MTSPGRPSLDVGGQEKDEPSLGALIDQRGLFPVVRALRNTVRQWLYGPHPEPDGAARKRPGRTSRVDGREDYYQAYDVVLRAHLVDGKEKPPSDAEIAHEFGISAKQLSRKRVEFGIPPPPADYFARRQLLKETEPDI